MGVTASTVSAEAEKRRIARAAGVISTMTLASRILGLVREQVFAATLGAGAYSDAFRIAFRVPNLLRDLFAEGALSAAFVPTYARVEAESGRDAASRLANRVLTLLAIVLGALVVLGFLGAHAVVSALAPGFEKQTGKAELTVSLTRVMLPFLPLVSFAAVAKGMLNAQERFATAALAPAAFNVVTIVWAALLWAFGFSPEQVVLGWAFGTLVGGLGQFLVQVPELVRGGWRFRPEWAPSDPGLVRIATLMAPATIGLAAVQVNVFVNSIFASQEPSAVSWLDYAFRLLYLPIGLFGGALGTIATAGLARRAAEGDLDGLRLTLRQSLSMLAYLTLPASVGMIVLAAPIVRLVYERGRFGPADTGATASALLIFAFGLVAHTAVRVVAPAFYALGRARVPLAGSVLAVAANLAVVALGHGRYGFRAIAVGTVLGSVVNAAFLLAVFDRGVGGLRGQGLVPPLRRMALAAAAMGAVAWALAEALQRWLGTDGLAARLAACLVPAAIGVVVYAVLSGALRVSEAGVLSRMVSEGWRARRTRSA